MQNILIELLKKLANSGRKAFWKTYFYLFFIFKKLVKWEKIIIVILLTMIIFSLLIIKNKNSSQNYQIVPAYGGVYREGIMANSHEKIDEVKNNLTKIGLVRFDQSAKIIPALASSWEISDDQKNYTFKLSQGFDAQELQKIIRQEKKDWSEIDIQNSDKETLVFVLKQPYSPFLASLSEPIFPYGPFIIKEEVKNSIIFSSRENFYFKRPYLDGLELKFYSDRESLTRAIKKGEIDGVNNADVLQDLPQNWQKGKLELPRYIMLFFNLKREVLQDKAIRQKIANNEPIGKEITLQMATSDRSEYLGWAERLKEQWKNLGINLEVVIKNPLDLQKEILPSRNYDLLLYGIDYGNDYDPYAFFHSTQVSESGLNLANFSHIDADKILEKARQTTNGEERDKLYQSWQKILQEERPALELEKVAWQYGLSQDVKGVVLDHKAITPADRLFEVWNWYLEEQKVKK